VARYPPFLHRFTGLLVLTALVHGWALDRTIGASAALKAVYVLIGAAGMAAYGYDELIRRRRAPQADYTVRSVRRPAPDVVDVTLAPTGPAPLPVGGGQFVYLRAGNGAWREHPSASPGPGPTAPCASPSGPSDATPAGSTTTCAKDSRPR
jgi:hypothetical protein